jgi:CheY-like chemotaxis protein
MTYRVLVVEDHAESAEGLVELLSFWGYEGHVADSGERALELLPALKPHAVIADIGLPGGIDGHELARRLRRMPDQTDTLLIALTGYRESSDEEFAASGFDHHLMKPVDLPRLERLLDEVRRIHA